MEILKMARELGKLIQNDERYIRVQNAKAANDNDQELQQAIGEFNLKRLSLNEQMNKNEKDSEKIAKLDKEIRAIYDKVMSNTNMIEYNEAKNDFESLMKQVNMIITYSANGSDPDSINTEQSCSGSCSGCSGCH